MPRFTIQTSGIETHYAARAEDGEKITAYQEALRARYGDEGDSLMYDALRLATKNFMEQARGKAILAYLDYRFGHLLTPTRAAIEAAAAQAAVEGLIDVSSLLENTEFGSSVERDPWWEQ